MSAFYVVVVVGSSWGGSAVELDILERETLTEGDSPSSNLYPALSAS